MFQGEGTGNEHTTIKSEDKIEEIPKVEVQVRFLLFILFQKREDIFLSFPFPFYFFLLELSREKGIRIPFVDSFIHCNTIIWPIFGIYFSLYRFCCKM